MLILKEVMYIKLKFNPNLLQKIEKYIYNQINSDIVTQRFTQGKPFWGKKPHTLKPAQCIIESKRRSRHTMQVFIRIFISNKLGIISTTFLQHLCPYKFLYETHFLKYQFVEK